MDYSLLLGVAFPIVGGLLMFRDGVKQTRRHSYLRERGVCTSATILTSSKRPLKETIDFSVAYQDEQQRTYNAFFYTNDANAKQSYTVGSEVSICYDPLQPKRSALAEEVNSPWRSYGLVILGVMVFATGLSLLWVLWPQLY